MRCTAGTSRCALDPGAQLSEEAAGLVVEHFASTMAFLLGFTGKPELAPTRLAIGAYTLVVDDQGIRIAEGVTDPSATVRGSGGVGRPAARRPARARAHARRRRR